MNKTCTSVLLSALAASSSGGESGVNVVPRPMTVERGDDAFRLRSLASIMMQPKTPDLEVLANYLSKRLNAATGCSFYILGYQPAAQSITLSTEGARPELGDEGYGLQVTPTRIFIRANKPAGVFYGIQTLLQLLPEKIQMTLDGAAWPIPAVHIVDKPRFPWRGLLLDVGRHFRDKEFVKRYIDLLAYHKMNVLHWHLTEDQGWRIEIKKYPRLTEVASKRNLASPVPAQYQNGFYTQDEIREVVAYAASRHITVMPEIEMPGHSTAALAAYPELSCTGGPFKVETNWGIHKEILCAGSEKSFEFVQDVLDEVLELFPSKFVHIGGDEVPKTRWKECPRCQQRIRDEGLKDEHELQSYFIRRIDKYLASKGRRLVGWDEILEGGLAPGATVMSWRGMDGAIAAAKMDHDVIATPNTHCYLDWPLNSTPLEKSYAFEPIPAEFTPEQARHVLGLQGNMWMEFYPLPRDTDRQVFPRLCALAEAGWSPREQRDFADFSRRMETHLRRLSAMGVHHSSEPLGQLIGHWHPEQMSEAFRDIEYKIWWFAHEAGTYEVTLNYEDGKHGLAAQWAAVFDDDKEVARDAHDAWAGAQLRANAFTFKLPAWNNTIIRTLRIHCRSDGGTDSHGSVWWKRVDK